MFKPFERFAPFKMFFKLGSFKVQVQFDSLWQLWEAEWQGLTLEVHCVALAGAGEK